MTILFFGLLFFVINLSPVEASSWSDPSCAPPGCNRPEPITVEGGTIQEGHSLTVQGDGVDTFDTSISSSGGFIVGSKIDVNPNASYATQDIFQINPSCYGNMDNCWGTYSSETAYFDKIIVASQGIALEEGQTISMPGNNGIYINGGLEGSYGFAVYARAADLNYSTLSGYDSGATEVKNSAAIWGVTTDKNISSDPYSGDICTTSVGREFDETNLCAYSYGGFFQGFTSRGIALHTRSYAGAYGAYLRGTILIGNGSNFVTTHNVYNDVVPWYTTSGTRERYPEFVVKTANTFWNNPGYNGTPSTYEEYEVLKVDSENPKQVQIGGPGTDYELCLNNDCITDWADVSGQGTGNAVFKTFSVPSGSDAVASNAADQLNFLNGENISITGSSDDNITISVDRTMDNMLRINGKGGDQLIIDPDDDEGLLIYDKVYVDDLGTCSKVYTGGSGRLMCGTDAVNDADSSTTNEIQNIDSVLGTGNSTTKTITVGQLCVGKVCINEFQLQELLFLIK